MKKLDEKFSDIFDVMPLEVPEEPPKMEITPAEVEIDSLDNDFSKARQNIHELLTKGSSAIDNLLKVAEESEHPRAYEVASNFIKTLADLNKDLLEIQKKKQELTGTSPSSGGNQTNIDKAVFIGSTADLIKMIKNKEE